MQVADRTNAFRRGQYLRALPASEEPPALLVGSYFLWLGQNLRRYIAAQFLTRPANAKNPRKPYGLRGFLELAM